MLMTGRVVGCIRHVMLFIFTTGFASAAFRAYRSSVCPIHLLHPDSPPTAAQTRQ